MKTLRVNFDEIQKAMEDIVRDSFDYYFDTETGEIISLSEEMMEELESRLYDAGDEELEEDIECIEYDEEPELPDWMLDEIDLALEVLLDEDRRYVRIPERPSDKAYKAMSGFSESIEESVLKVELIDALTGKGAFRKFKDVLIHHPKERKRWHGFNAKAMKKEVTLWLESIGVEPLL